MPKIKIEGSDPDSIELRFLLNELGLIYNPHYYWVQKPYKRFFFLKERIDAGKFYVKGDQFLNLHLHSPFELLKKENHKYDIYAIIQKEVKEMLHLTTYLEGKIGKEITAEIV